MADINLDHSLLFYTINLSYPQIFQQNAAEIILSFKFKVVTCRMLFSWRLPYFFTLEFTSVIRIFRNVSKGNII